MKIKEEIKEEYNGLKAKIYLKDVMGFSSRLASKAFMNKEVFINGTIIKANHILTIGDLLEVELKRDETQDILAEKMDIDIRYEDDDVIVVNKPPNMVVHPTKSYQSGTLANGILYYLNEKNKGSIARLVNRLDMNTSGLVMVAKSSFAHSMIAKEFQNNNCTKKYIAIIHGKMEKESGRIDLPIYRPLNALHREVNELGQRSITDYKVIEELKDAQILELHLLTGRTHQIRVHLSHLGHPIFGDTLYGADENDNIDRQALHSYYLKFNNPRTKEEIIVESDIPNDMKILKESLKV